MVVEKQQHSEPVSRLDIDVSKHPLSVYSIISWNAYTCFLDKQKLLQLVATVIGVFFKSACVPYIHFTKAVIAHSQKWKCRKTTLILNFGNRCERILAWVTRKLFRELASGNFNNVLIGQTKLLVDPNFITCLCCSWIDLILPLFLFQKHKPSSFICVDVMRV